MIKHGLTINDFSDINEHRRLIEEYGDMNACYRGENADGEYYNCWGVTDNNSSDCLYLKIGVDFTEVK